MSDRKAKKWFWRFSISLFIALCLLGSGLFIEKAHAATRTAFHITDDINGSYVDKAIGLPNGRIGFVFYTNNWSEVWYKVLNADGSEAFSRQLFTGLGSEVGKYAYRVYPFERNNGDTLIVYVEDKTYGNSYAELKYLTVDKNGTVSSPVSLATSTYMYYPTNAVLLSNGGVAVTYHNDTGSDYGLHFYNSSMGLVKSVTFTDLVSQVKRVFSIAANNNDRVMLLKRTNSTTNAFQASLYDNSGNLIKDNVFTGTNVFVSAISNGNFAFLSGDPATSLSMSIYDQSGNAVGSSVDLGGPFGPVDADSYVPTWPNPILMPTADGRVILYDFSSTTQTARVKEYSNAGAEIKAWAEADSAASSQYGYTPYTLFPQPGFGVYSDMTGDLVLYLMQLPTISSHPANQTVTQGQSATFSVTAAGDAPFSYQWKKNGTNISGANAASLTIASAQSGDAGSYSVEVTNGGGSVTSNAATLTINHTITYDKNGGDTNASPATKTVVSGGNVGTLPTPPTRANYTFTGWNTAANGSGSAFTATTPVTANQTVYAQWTLNTYTVTFDKNGGDTNASPTTKTATHGGNIGTLPTAPARDGYVFANWNTAADGSGSPFTATTAVTANQIVYAQWTPNTYTVTFDKNGGDTNANPATKTASHGGNVGTLPTDPTRANYTFAGWNTAANGSGGAFTATTAVTSNQTVYAQWTLNAYTVTFDKNGGDTNANPATKTASHGDNVGTLPTEPTRAGHTFAGWNTAVDGSGSAFTATTVVIANQTVYAQWTVNTYTVTFDKNGGDADASPTMKTADYGGNVGTLPTEPTRANYTFTGWDTAANGSGSAFTATTVVTADQTVYAQWELNTYTVTFDRNGGDTDASPATKTAVHGTNVGSLPTQPTRLGDTFASWNTAADGSGDTFTSATVVTANRTVYAQWTLNTYTITFDKNGGDTDASPTTKTATHGGSLDELPVEPMRPGHTFTGWNTATDGSGSTFTETTVITANRTVYAQWTLNTYTVTFDKNGGDTNADPATATVNHGDNVGTLPQEPTRAHYTFASWNTAADGSGSAFTATTVVTANQTVYAQWTLNTYTITFDKNGGDTDASPTTKTATHGGNVGTLPAEPTKTGRTFAGWNTAADGSGSAFTATTVVTANQTVYAQWTLNTYTVTFDTNGGDTNADPATATVNHGGNTGTLPQEPTRAHYTFSSWNTAADGSGSTFTEATVVTANQTVYAQWTQITYLITYASGPNGSISATTELVGSGETPAAIPTVTPDSDYVFAGWSSDGGLSKLTSAQLASTTITAPITYTAYFIPSVPGVPNIVNVEEGDGKVSLTWSPVNGATAYTIYQSVTSSTYGIEVKTVTGSVYGDELTGLTNGTVYYFVVTAINDGGESAASNQVSATPKSVPTAPTNIVATAGDRQATITFDPPSSNGGSAVTGYQVIASPGGIVATGTTNSITITGLTNGTTYTFTVIAINSVGSSQASDVSNTITPSAPRSNQPEAETPNRPETQKQGAEILVNGKAENAGTVTTTARNDQTVTTITVDQQKVEEKLAAEGQGAVITIPVNTRSEVVIGELNGQMVKNMEQKQAVVAIKTDHATYTLPAQQINISAISEQLGQDVTLQDITVKIEIAEPLADKVKVVENSAAAGEFTLVVPPMEFTVTASSGNATVEISRFNAYVERTIALPDGVDPEKITTGIVVEADGTVRHVPTKVINVDGKYYAKINSLTNSTYSVVWHPHEFKDVADHWAKEAVNDLGSRMVVNGITEDIFQPEQDITRAEFAAIMVRALGLKLESGTSPFADVKPSDWFSSAVLTAHSYNLISGFEDGTFRPSDKITREQAMIIVAKAMALTNLKNKLPAGSEDEVLSKFIDSLDVSAWARNDVAATLRAGLVTGRNGGQLAPKSYISRAEVAAVIQRLLQKSELI